MAGSEELTKPASPSCLAAFAASPLMSVPLATEISINFGAIVGVLDVGFDVAAIGSSLRKRRHSSGAKFGSHWTAPKTPLLS